MVSGDKNPPLIKDSWAEARRARKRFEECEEDDIISIIEHCL